MDKIKLLTLFIFLSLFLLALNVETTHAVDCLRGTPPGFSCDVFDANSCPSSTVHQDNPNECCHDRDACYFLGGLYWCNYLSTDPDRPAAGAGECCDVGCTDSGWSNQVQNDANCGLGEVCDASCSCVPAGPACVPDGLCNGVCPPGCGPGDVALDPDCGCQDGDGCCGIGCDNTNDNDCPAGPPPGACPPECPCTTPDCEGGLVPCGRSCDDPTTDICECCPCTLCHLFVMFKRIVDFAFLNIVIPLAILMSVIGGIMLLTAAGNPGQISQGKAVIKAVIIGLVIIFASWMIVNTVVTFLTPATSPLQSWHTIDCPVP